MDLFTEKYAPILENTGIVPVICLKNEAELHTFSEAVLSTAVRCVEITLRHPFSPTAIRYIKEHIPEITAGAGTVKTLEALDTAVSCGADFCVAPGMEDGVLSAAIKQHIPYLPGCATPSEFMKAVSLGYETVKLFPAECMGGVSALKLYESAFPELRFLSTGGITTDNFPQYTACSNVLACGGSFMVPKTALAEGNSQKIAEVINACVATYQEKRKKHG